MLLKNWIFKICFGGNVHWKDYEFEVDFLWVSAPVLNGAEVEFEGFNFRTSSLNQKIWSQLYFTVSRFVLFSF